MQLNKKWGIIFKAGLVAGLLDITGAILVYVLLLNLTTAQRILQSIAAGALGKTAYTGGWSTASLGLLFHFMIALIFAALYMLLHPYWKKFFGNPVIAGVCYGILTWCIMNFLVLPTANGKMANLSIKNLLIGISLIIFCVGIPIAIITEKSLVRSKAIE